MIEKLALALAIGLSSTALASVQSVTEPYKMTRAGELLFRSYPAESLRLGEQGIVGYRISLFRDGQIRSCKVISSSGFPRLDGATCDMILKYLNVKSAKKRGNGRAVRNGKVLWSLPGRDSPPPPTTSVEELASVHQEILCRQTLQVGSLYRKTKLCLTRKDWSHAEDNARMKTEAMRGGASPSTE